MNDDVITQRVLPLAALLQTLQEVRHLAENGRVDQGHLDTAIGSVLRIDADSVADVYGGVAPVADGLRTLIGYFDNRLGDPALPKLALAVLQLERSFSKDDVAMGEVHAGISRIARQAEGEGVTHPDILKGLGEVYAQTLSSMKPKVMVQGSPHYLGQPQVVGEIRALLLSALRSAVLWRQMGGTQWDLLLKRGEMKRAANALLATT